MLVEHDVFPNPCGGGWSMFQGGPRQDDELKLSDLTPKPAHVLVHDVFPAGFKTIS